MAIKTYRPITPTLRFQTSLVNDDLTTNKPHKPLLAVKQRTGGIATNPRPENHFSMNRHPPTGAAFDNGNGSCEGGTNFDGRLLMKVAKP